MSEHVVIDQHPFGNRQLGHIHLNNPKALNALSLDMAEAFLSQLNAWKNDETIVAILVTGEGEKAFCAGGDIQAMYHAMKNNPGGPAPETETFFEKEYLLDHTLHTYSKPVITWGDGIVMGGGLGIFMGGDFRVVSEISRLAMPEITIGLYPDVGASYFYNQLPDGVGRFLGLTGAIVNANDALALSLATHCLPHGHLSLFLDTLKTTQINEDAHAQISECLSTLTAQHPAPLPAAQVIPNQTIIAELCSNPDTCLTLEAILALETSDDWLNRAQANLENGSPLSARLIDEQLRRHQTSSLSEAFRSELILSTNIVRFTELAEGIRALLIDKDRNPHWHYSHPRDVPASVVEGFFESPWVEHPYDGLIE